MLRTIIISFSSVIIASLIIAGCAGSKKLEVGRAKTPAERISVILESAEKTAGKLEVENNNKKATKKMSEFVEKFEKVADIMEDGGISDVDIEKAIKRLNAAGAKVIIKMNEMMEEGSASRQVVYNVMEIIGKMVEAGRRVGEVLEDMGIKLPNGDKKEEDGEDDKHRHFDFSAKLTTDGGIICFISCYYDDWDSWKFELSDSVGRVIKAHKGEGTVPMYIYWNGLDSDGSHIPLERFKNLSAKFTLTYGNKMRTKEESIEDPASCDRCWISTVWRKDENRYVFYYNDREDRKRLIVVRDHQYENNSGADNCKLDDEKISANFDGIEMVSVKGGTFTMGCTKEQEEHCEDNEKPVHEVTVSDFYISKYMITQKQWLAVAGSYPLNFRSKNRTSDNLPIVAARECIMWFIEQLNAKTGKKYRLATEAEWEYAARGGAESKGYIYAGSDNISEVAWCCGKDNYELNPIGAKEANELGIYGMSENPEELVSDAYALYGPSPQTNPKGPPNLLERIYEKSMLHPAQIYRGGNGRVSARMVTKKDWGSFGIRLVLDK